MMELRREVLEAEYLDPREDFAPTRTTVEVRWDPLTGHTSRIVPPRGLMPASDFDLEALATATAGSCPFCPERIDRLTPRFAPAIVPAGRIAHGQAILFPNLHPYGRHSSVSVYSPELHFLPLERMTAQLVADNLATQAAFARAVVAADPEARWISVNANHMLPSGSSLFHPHLQGIADPFPTTIQRLLADVPAGRVDDYLRTERAAGERYLGDTGRVQWLASFAPLAPGELRAFIAGVASPAELDDELVAELGHGIATAMNIYAELGVQSCNLALYGAPPGTDGYRLNLRIACRSPVDRLYRSDATHLERLHWEAAIDSSPEALAERAGDRFRR
jgi:UDPglucose--hexose-1-phosphate uridylyltransferase